MQTMQWNSKAVEDKIGIQFKRSEILFLALVHPSYAQQNNKIDEDNQRLVSLGDTVLNLVIVDYLYYNFAHLEVTKLEQLRDKLVESSRLTKLWFQLGLGDAYPFVLLKEDRYTLSQGRDNPFQEALKALIGAIYLDRGFVQTRNWLTKYLLLPLLERHLKQDRERLYPNKQLQFLGEALFKAVVIDYLYRHLPYVSPNRLTAISKELMSQERRSEYIKQLNDRDWDLITKDNEKFPRSSFKTVLAAIYLQFASSSKDGFRQTCQWFVERYVDGDEVLRRAIALLLKDGKPQKWIIRNVMGYESKDYQKGKDRFHELMEDRSLNS
jgi:dsRNA-specific ribonuclease